MPIYDDVDDDDDGYGNNDRMGWRKDGKRKSKTKKWRQQPVLVLVRVFFVLRVRCVCPVGSLLSASGYMETLAT